MAPSRVPSRTFPKGMKPRDLVITVGLAGVGLLAYGTFTELEKLTYEVRVLPLPGWPERLRGYRIALLADMHIKGPYSAELAQRSVMMAIEAEPDMIVLAGDFVDYWTDTIDPFVTAALEPLLLMDGNVVAVPGNHDYERGPASRLRAALEPLNVHVLQNEIWTHGGIRWVGIDSFNAKKADPSILTPSVDPTIVVWHEPDAVDFLPNGAHLMLSGHSHGGQFIFPFGITPKHSTMGKKYPQGFYPNAPTPLYVTRGVGTTFFPSRLNCLPEVSILSLVPGDAS